MFPIAILSFCLFAFSIAISPVSPSPLSDPILPVFPSQFNKPPPGSTSDQNRSAPPLVNEITWARRVACFHGPGRSLDELACMRAINKMLIQPGSGNIETFGTEGTYTGPRSWTSSPCTIAIDLTHIRTYSNSLLIFAKCAAQVNEKCYKEGSLYYGGVCDIVDIISMEFIRLAVTKTPDSVSHDTNATFVLSSSLDNTTAQLRPQESPVMAAQGSQSSSETA